VLLISSKDRGVATAKSVHTHPILSFRSGLAHHHIETFAHMIYGAVPQHMCAKLVRDRSNLHAHKCFQVIWCQQTLNGCVQCVFCVCVCVCVCVLVCVCVYVLFISSKSTLAWTLIGLTRDVHSRLGQQEHITMDA